MKNSSSVEAIAADRREERTREPASERARELSRRFEEALALPAIARDARRTQIFLDARELTDLWARSAERGAHGLREIGRTLDRVVRAMSAEWRRESDLRDERALDPLFNAVRAWRDEYERTRAADNADRRDVCDEHDRRFSDDLEDFIRDERFLNAERSRREEDRRERLDPRDDARWNRLDRRERDRREDDLREMNRREEERLERNRREDERLERNRREEERLERNRREDERRERDRRDDARWERDRRDDARLERLDRRSADRRELCLHPAIFRDARERQSRRNGE